MLDMWERWVQFHELYLPSEPEEAPRILLKELLPHLIERINAKESVKIIKKDSAAIRIVGAREYPESNAVVLLLQYADKNVTDPVFSNLETGELRTEPKLDGEGIAVSAHMVLSTEPYDEENMFYRLLLEEVPGLGRSNVSPFIRSELKAISKGLFEYPDPDDNHKMKRYSPAAEIVGKPSRQLTEELSTGCILQSIELVKFTRAEPEIDEEGYYTESTRHIKLIPQKTVGDNIIEMINKVRQKSAEMGYNDVKIRYKKPQGKQKTATMGSTMSDLQDALVVKDELIKADELLPQCSEEIIESFSNSMIGLIPGE